METSLTKYVSQDVIKNRFEEILGNRAGAFISSIISIANSNAMLKNATPQSLVMSGLMAATLNLPINQNLGFAYIIPYKRKSGSEWVTEAQFQLGYRGLIQLAQRSGQFKTINVTDVKENEIKSNNRLTGEITFDWIKENRDSLKTVGFVGYFELINGFSKTLYMSVEQLQKHGLKYSKLFSGEKTRENSLWTTDFNTMAGKTVIKLLLSKYAPLSIDMQKAITSDQAVIKEIEPLDIDYVDTGTESISETNDIKEKERIEDFISNAKTKKELEQLDLEIIYKYDLKEVFETKLKEVK